MPRILVRSIAELRKGLIGWSIGLAGLGAFTLAFWPSLRGNEAFDDIMKELPEALLTLVGEKSVTSPAGYLESQLFLYLIPALFAVITIGRSADGIAGEERRMTMDLLLANPVMRGRVVVEKFVAYASSLAIPGVVLFVTLVAGAVVVDMDIGWQQLAAAVIGSMLIAIVFGALSLAIAAATARKALANGIAATAMIGSYLLNSIAPMVEGLQPYQKLSPFYYYLSSSPLENGLRPLHVAVLVVVAVILVVLAVWSFDRRDVTMG